MAKVLIAIPNYNNRKFIVETINSVLKQNIQDLDVVVFDNHSGDGVVELLVASFGGRIKIFVNPANVGAVANHNLCLDYAEENNYDFVKLLSSDDVLVEGVITKEIEMLERNPDVSLVISNMIVVDPDLNEIRRVRFFGAETPCALLNGADCIILTAKRHENLLGGPSGLLIRVNACKSIRFDSSYKWISDLKFAADLIKGRSFVNSGLYAFYYRRHSDTDSKSLEKRFLLKTWEFLKYSALYGGGVSGIIRGFYNLMRNFKVSISGRT